MRTPGSKKVALVVAVCFLTTAVLPANRLQAGFADSWVAQKSGTAPSVFQGSQKGYLNGGSFSARWPQSSDHLLSVSPPSIKSGCGGIDLFLGSMSFLNVDFLVSKLQRILAAAPAAAFDIALKTLAPQVATTIKDMEAIVDKLNGLQIDDCKASKALVASVADPLSPLMNDAMKAEMHSAKADFMITKGVNDLYAAGDALFKRATAPDASPTDQQANKAVTTGSIAGCPAELKPFAGGSVLANLGAVKGLSTGVIDAMRGFIGDAIVSDSTEGPIAKYIAPADSATFEDMVDGQATPIHESGVAYTDAEIAAMPKANLILYVKGMLSDIVSSIKERTAHTLASVGFMESVPLPIFPALRAGVQTKQEAAMVDNLADTTARMFAYQMVLDLIARVDNINSYSDAVKSAKTTADPGQSRVDCSLVFFANPMAIVSKLGVTAQQKRKEAYEGITSSNQAKANVAALVDNIKSFDRIAKEETTRRFGSGVANRVASYNDYK